MSSERRKWTSWQITETEIFVGFLAVIVCMHSLGLYGQTVAGLRELTYDAQQVWQPMAHAMASGSRPYIEYADNKPPLFIYLVALGGVTNFTAALFCFTAIANMTVVITTYQWCVDNEMEDAGIIAALLVTGTIIMLSAGINNKIFGVAVLLCTLRARRPIWVGSGLALAALFAQPLVLAIPVVALWKAGTDLRKLGTIAVAGIVTVVFSYGSLALVWDIKTAVAGVEQSLLSSGSYVQGTSQMFGQNLSVLSRPEAWFKYFRGTLMNNMVLLVIGGFAGGSIAVRRQTGAARFMIMLTLSLSIALLIRPYWHYWLMVVPPLSMLAGYGLVEISKTHSPT
jgi:hypothetical protein